MPSKNSTATTTRINAIDLLKKDHATVRKQLDELAEMKPRAAQKRALLFARIAEALKAHTTIEEEIFYPAYHEAAKTHEDEKLFFEAAEEHGLVDIVIGALEAGDPASEEYGAKCKVLKDLVEHHAEEEETEMFPRATKLIGKPGLLELGEQMQARKEELLSALPGTTRKSRSNGKSKRSTVLDRWH